MTLRGPDRARRGTELGHLGIVRDGAVLARDGRIVAVGTTDAVARQLRRRHIRLSQLHEIDCRGRLVAPGLVDSHTHLVFAAPRLEDFERRIAGMSDARIARAGGGILASVRTLRAASDDRLLQAARSRLRCMRSHGVTTVEIKSGYGLTPDDEFRMLRLARLAAASEGLDAALTFLGAHALPAEYAGRRREYLRLVRDHMLPALGVLRAFARAGQRRRPHSRWHQLPPAAEFFDVFCDPLAFTLQESRMLLLAARTRGFKLKLHADQNADSGGAGLAVRCAAVSADHLDCTPPAARRRLARSETVATFLPGVSLFLNRRFPAARDWIADGAAVCLASDCNPGTSPLLSLPMAMALACNGMRLTPAEVWQAVTINAASALNRARLCGSLQRGKRADLAIFGVDDYRAIPYFLGGNFCAGVLLSGRWVPAGV